MAFKVYGAGGLGDAHYDGFVKVKLVHAQQGSLIVPDQLYFRSPQAWFQPNTFLPCQLIKSDDSIECRLRFDLGDASLELTFDSNGLIDKLDDGSFTYECTVRGPGDLLSKASGSWDSVDGRPHLRLFHHTDDKGHFGITSSGEFWSSAWNIQGTKKLSNVGYIYFTSLPTIRNGEDLAAIAMSPNRKLHFIRDGAVAPKSLPPEWKTTTLSNDVLEVEVYWSAPEMRNRTLAVQVDSTRIAPSHLLRHVASGVWYEVSRPAIFRVGVEPGSVLPWDGTKIGSEASYRVFDYMIIGDATSVTGLSAPLDEENTSETFRIHRIAIPPLQFWFQNSNTDHFSGLAGPEQDFEK